MYHGQTVCVCYCSCSFDYLEIFDGSDVGAPSMGRFCGDKFASISSTQRFLTLQFTTDGSAQMSGFKLHYNFTEEVIRKYNVSP